LNVKVYGEVSRFPMETERFRKYMYWLNIPVIVRRNSIVYKSYSILCHDADQNNS